MVARSQTSCPSFRSTYQSSISAGAEQPSMRPKKGRRPRWNSLKAVELEIRNSISQTYREINPIHQQAAVLQSFVHQDAAPLADEQHNQGLIDQLALAINPGTGARCTIALSHTLASDTGPVC